LIARSIEEWYERILERIEEQVPADLCWGERNSLISSAGHSETKLPFKKRQQTRPLPNAG